MSVLGWMDNCSLHFFLFFTLWGGGNSAGAVRLSFLPLDSQFYRIENEVFMMFRLKILSLCSVWDPLVAAALHTI